MSNAPPSWYVVSPGRPPNGPLTAEQIVQAVETQSLAATNLCWCEGMPQWLPLAQVEPFSRSMGLSGTGTLGGVTPPPIPFQSLAGGPRASSGIATGFAIAGLVIAIPALLFSLIPLLGAFAIFPGSLAILLSLVGLTVALATKSRSGGLAISALVVSVLPVAISAFWLYSAHQLGKAMGPRVAVTANSNPNRVPRAEDLPLVVPETSASSLPGEEVGGAQTASLNTSDLAATLRYASDLFKEWQDELGRVRGQTEGNNIAAEKETARVNQQNVKKIAGDLSKLEGQSVQWRFTVTQILEDFINFREAPNTGYVWPNDKSTPVFIWFSNRSGEEFAGAPGYLKIKGNISRSDAEKLRPGDSLLIRARARVLVAPVSSSALRVAIQLNNIHVLVLGDKAPNSPEVKNMLAQREKEEEARLAEEADVRRKTLLSAAPGTRYGGTITHNTEKTAQQILLVFTAQANSALRVQIINPEKPQRQQTFSGQVVSNLEPLDDGSRPFIIQTKAVSTGFGYDSGDQKNWWSWQPDRLFALFFCDDKATLSLRVTDDGMEGLGYVPAGNVFTLRLKRLQGSAPASSAQNPLAGNSAETQPESEFLGEWTNRDFQTLGITRIHIIRASGSSRIVVRFWTKSNGPTGERSQGEANAAMDNKGLSLNPTPLGDVDRLEITLLENGDVQVDAHPRFSGRESVDHISGKSVFGKGLVHDWSRSGPRGPGGPAIGNATPPINAATRGRGPLSGVWQCEKTGARFRLEDDGTSIEISVESSRSRIGDFSGKLTRHAGEADSKSFDGTLAVTFGGSSKRRVFPTTATLVTPDKLHLRCADWPTYAPNGRLLGEGIHYEDWTRSN